MGIIAITKRVGAGVPVTGYTITQPGHGFSVGTAVKLSDSLWVKAWAKDVDSAGTVGIVAEMYDVNTFRVVTQGLVAGNYLQGRNYILSTITAGTLTILEATTPFYPGQVYEFIGTGVPEGLLVEIAVGQEVMEDVFEDHDVSNMLFNTLQQKLTLRRNGKEAIDLILTKKFNQLTDVPDYTGKGGFFVRVKPDESGLDYLSLGQMKLLLNPVD
ncbi:MAG TPA: hypothetical protein DCL77_09065 [Prolixibacteraceae bacterium]|jgi:hypothetical protein|nr:hypothetical protein [Prolixibacteraceae bacterium]